MTHEVKDKRTYITPAEAFRWASDRRTPVEQEVMEHVIALAGGLTPYLPECEDYVGWEDTTGDVVVMVRRTYVTATGRAANLTRIAVEWADRETTPNIEVGGWDTRWESFRERPRRERVSRTNEPKAPRRPSRAAVRRDAATGPVREVCGWDDECHIWAGPSGLCSRHDRELQAALA